jgi:hypothetical protein
LGIVGIRGLADPDRVAKSYGGRRRSTEGSDHGIVERCVAEDGPSAKDVREGDMRRERKPLGFLLFLTTQLPGCGAGVLGSSWVDVREQTACEAMNPQYCVGRYGFTVRNDGSFLVGPAEDGVTMGGGLSAAELAQISSDAGALSSSNLRGAPECDSGRVIPGSGLSVDITLNDQTTVTVVQNLCYRGGRDRAVKLRDDLDGLTQKYYPRPFPP